MSSSATKTTANRQPLYRLTYRILNSHSLHFIPISLLFLPFTFSTFAAVRFYYYISSYSINFNTLNLIIIKTIITSSQNLLTIKTLITIIAFLCIVILPAIIGVALITYTTNQIIHRKHLNFSSAFKSLLHSFIPFLHTLIVGSVALTVIFPAFTLFPIILTKTIQALGFHFDQFIFSILINVTFSYVLAFSMVYFLVIWGSAAAITVLESKSGFEALQQSANLSTEFRRRRFSSSTMFSTGFGSISLWYYSSISQNWILSILQVGVLCLLSSLMILTYVVANTVLYAQCKVESEEEVAVTTVEGGEYVRVGVSDEKGEVVVHELDEKEVNINGAFVYMMYMLCIVYIFLVLI